MDASRSIDELKEMIHKSIRESGFEVSQYRLADYSRAVSRVFNEISKTATSYLEFQIIVKGVLDMLESVRVKEE